MLADEQYASYVVMSEIDLRRVRQGIELTTVRWDLLKRKQVIAYVILQPEYYDFKLQLSDGVEAKVTIHNQHPRRFMTSIAAIERNPEGHEMGATMLTTTYPDPVVCVIWFEDASWLQRPASLDRDVLHR